MNENSGNTNCQCHTKKKTKSRRCFDWIQLLVTFSVPVAIAVYTFLQNNNDQEIAFANREKDLEIARYRREQDLQLAADQQKANILSIYETFLVNHLNEYGMTLNESSSARYIARLKTLTTLNQLDPIRRKFVIQSLFEGKLIVNDKNSDNPYGPGIISLEEGDLSGIYFEDRDLEYLSLPKSNLTRARFVFVKLSCVNFYNTILINSDFSDSVVLLGQNQCFKNAPYTIFKKAIMTNTSLAHAEFLATEFSESNLDYANMRHFLCSTCIFSDVNMSYADLTSSLISTDSSFLLTYLTKTVLVRTTLKLMTITSTKFIRNEATNIRFENCSLQSTDFSRCQMDEALITHSNFSNIAFFNVNLRNSLLTNVYFTYTLMNSTDLTNTIFEQCTFINHNFNNSILQNVSFINCTFQKTFISDEHRSQITTFNGSVFL